MLKYSRLLVVGLFLLFVSTVKAADFYISPTGTDSGTCTSSSPCATLYYVTATTCHSGWSVNPGDTINVNAGTYNAVAVTNTNQVNSACGNSVQTFIPLGRVVRGGNSSNYLTIQATGATFQRIANADTNTQNGNLIRYESIGYVKLIGINLIGMKGRVDDNETSYAGETSSVDSTQAEVVAAIFTITLLFRIMGRLIFIDSIQMALQQAKCIMMQ